MQLPKEIGSHIEIPTHDQDLRRYAESRGFVMESGTAKVYLMRRDFHDGALRPIGT